MVRHRFPAYENDSQSRYLVIWDLQWHVLECERLEAATDFRAAMAAAIARFEGDGWQAEGSARYGSVFVRRGPERCLLSLTSRDPFDDRPQSFSPFRRDVR